MKNRFVKILLLESLLFELLTSPIPYNKQEENNSKYSNLLEFMSSKDFQECISKSNEIKYVTDSVVYGKEYWQSFEETNSLKTGDCNDKSPYLCYFLNQKYPGFYIAIGYLDSSKRNKRHMWIEHEEDSTLIIEPNFKIPSNLDELSSVNVLNRKELGKGAYYNVDIRNYERNFKEFKKRTKIRLPVKK